MWLQLTSASFATIVWHAHVRQLSDIVLLSLLVTVFSLWFHCTKDRTIVVFDYAFAYLYFFYTALNLWKRRSKIIWLSVMLATTNAFLCNSCDPAEQLGLHVLMHLQVLAGSHIYIVNMGRPSKDF